MKTFEIKKLSWDSDFFGYKVGAVSVEEPIDILLLLDFIKNTDFKLIYLFSNQQQNRLSHDIYGDIKVTFSYDLIDEVYQVDENIIDFNAIRLSNLFDLSLQSGEFSRFKLDINFKNFEFERLYFQWILNSLEGKIADKVFVYSEDLKIKGMITLKMENECAEIGLIGVDENARGKGIGKKLINKVKSYAQSKGCEILKVPTQEINKKAINFYKSCGFEIIERKYIYNIWN